MRKVKDDQRITYKCVMCGFKKEKSEFARDGSTGELMPFCSICEQHNARAREIIEQYQDRHSGYSYTQEMLDLTVYAYAIDLMDTYLPLSLRHLIDMDKTAIREHNGNRPYELNLQADILKDLNCDGLTRHQMKDCYGQD